MKVSDERLKELSRMAEDRRWAYPDADARDIDYALTELLALRKQTRAAPEPQLGTCDSSREGYEPHTKCPECRNWQPLPAPPERKRSAGEEQPHE